MPSIRAHRRLIALGFVVVDIVCMIIFGLSASQLANNLQSGSDDECTDLSKGGFLAVYRPSRWILNSDKSGNDSNDKYSYCSWKSINSTVRMSVTGVVVLFSILAVWGILNRQRWPVWIHIFLMFISSSLLFGGMVFDANDVSVSKDWCQSGENGAPKDSTCVYDPYVTTIFAELGLTIVLYVCVFFTVRFLQIKTRLIDPNAADEQTRPIHQASAI
eukprot:TRINITY_DN81698_c0_g1_i1.p1 TRINITY_DN81698_c0_g1~~TRINITY_DN81698_c0_g1_i1.p1  ORF type:complete len:217 (+),score=33.85 TRINITY_DN81698_c0_g1_i1:90-740(+)